MENTTGHHSQDDLDETDDQGDDHSSPHSPKTASSSRSVGVKNLPESVDHSISVDRMPQAWMLKNPVPQSIQRDVDEGGDLSDY